LSVFKLWIEGDVNHLSEFDVGLAFLRWSFLKNSLVIS